MALVAIDMTPVFPGGENGGAKLLAMELIKGFQSNSGSNRFLILTASWNHEDLACLDTSNTQRLCIIKKQAPQSLPHPGLFKRNLGKIYNLVRSFYSEKLQQHGPLRTHGVDVLFCPFTAPTHAEPGIPVISIIHDLQHKDYPQFFSHEVVNWRSAFVDKVCKRADAIICVSENTKKSVLAHLKVDPNKVHMVHNCIQSRLPEVDSIRVARDLKKFNIGHRQYMFYPANFWPHKNHCMLITAYGMYVARNPGSKIDLVFTGALDEAQKNLKDNVQRMGLDNRIHFLGYLPEEQLTSVWQGCSFLIFPSLYEGFGIPVLEAMQFGKPVLCSDVTSLPEVAGDAALYFNPRKTEDIVQCMEKITSDKKLYSDLVKRGYNQLSYFESADMVKKYLQIIEKVVGYSRKFHDEAEGIYSDGWTGNKLDITYDNEKHGRILELIMEVPPHVPYKKATISLNGSSKIKQKWTLKRGQRHEIKLPLRGGENHLIFLIKPTFIPSEHEGTTDKRVLGVLCRQCRIILPSGEYKTLWPDK